MCLLVGVAYFFFKKKVGYNVECFIFLNVVFFENRNFNFFLVVNNFNLKKDRLFNVKKFKILK